MDETPTVLAAFGAGVLSIVSPGFAPLVPAFCAFVWRRRLAHLAACLLGFSLIFVALGAGATTVGRALLEHLAVAERVAGLTLIALGVLDLRASGRSNHPTTRDPREPATAATIGAAFVAGAALMFGWTPIAGVVLGRILAIATSAETIDRGVWLLAVNAAGRALPLAVLGFAISAFRRAPAASQPHRGIRLLWAGIVTLTGLLIFSGLFPRIAAALVELLPLA